MTKHDGPTPRRVLPFKPNAELLIAHALDACIRAERLQPGSSAEIIARQPPAARAELRRLLAMAQSIEHSAEQVNPSPEFVDAARARLIQRITGEHVARGGAPIALTAGWLRPIDGARRSGRGRRRWHWLARSSIGVFAAVLATTATLTASASAVPGDPLYGIKQAQEELNLRLAADDQARVLALLRRADARLDETTRLLQQGRTSEAVQMAQRYDESVERATSAFVVTVDVRDDPARNDSLEVKLGEQQQRLESIIQVAPEPARPDLREALATTERGRELMADPRPAERAIGLRQQGRVQSQVGRVAAAAAPTTHFEDVPTRTPTQPPTAVPATATPVVVLARAQEPESELARGDNREGGDRGGGRNQEEERPVVAVAPAPSGGVNAGRGSVRQSVPVVRGNSSQERGGGDEGRSSNSDQSDQVAVEPPVVAEDEPQSSNARGGGEGRVELENHGSADRRAEQAAVARSGNQASSVPAADTRTGSSGRVGGGNGEATAATSGESNDNGSGSASRQAPPPQPAPAPVRTGGSGSGSSSGSATVPASSGSGSGSGRTVAPAPTATKHGGTDSRPASDRGSTGDGEKSSGTDDR